MEIRNPFALLRGITKKSATIPSSVLNLGKLDQKEKDLIRRVGITFSQLQQDLQADVSVTWDRQRYTVQLNRSLDHALIASAMRLYAASSCLTGDTKIPLLNGETKTIREIVEDFNFGKEMWVYSCTTEGVPLPAKLLNAVEQKHKPKTFRIWLDNEKYVDASDNHRFLKRDGTLCRADELKVGDSLMPLHRQGKEVKKWKGYEQIWNIKEGKWISTYKMVSSYCSGINLKEHNKGKNIFKDREDSLVVHHIDFNKNNNVPSNLKIMTSGEHHKLHVESIKERWQDIVWHDMMVQKNKESHNTKEYKEKNSGENCPNWIFFETRKCLNPECSNEYEVKTSSKRKYCSHKCSILDKRKVKVFITRTCKCSEECEEQFSTQIYLVGPNHNKCFSPHHTRKIEKEKRFCLYCGEEFGCKSNSSRRYCSPSCSNYMRALPRETRVCKNEKCYNTFNCRITDTKKFCSYKCSSTCGETNERRGSAISTSKTGRSYEELFGDRAGEERRKRVKKKYRIPSYNHKVVKIEDIGKQVVYDIEVEGTHLFGLDCDIYVHNTSISPFHNASVWITSKSTKYQKVLSNLLDDIGIEEKIFDWAWTVGAFGDLFIEINGLPNLGVVSIEDGRNPVEISRIEHNGILVGFYETPMGHTSSAERKIIEPWKWVHLRLLGAKRARPAWGDPSYTEFKTMSLMLGHDTRQASSRYGTSLILDALPTYRRLRMAEDSILLARMTRGVLRYLYKMKVDACLTGDTKIELLNGKTPTIKEMAENSEEYIGKSTFSVDEKTGKLIPNRIKDVHITRRDTQIVRIHLDNDKFVDCTPDHKFMLRNGEYKEAQDLQPNDSLMPYYTRVPNKVPMVGYRQVYSPGDNKWHYIHRYLFGRLKGGKVVHHIDFDKLNNDPANLQVMERAEHTKFHFDLAKKYGFSYSMLGRIQTEEHIQKRVDSRRATAEERGYWASDETRRIMSDSSKKPTEVRVCSNPTCFNTFEVNMNSSRKYCTRDCAYKSPFRSQKGIKVFTTKVCECGDCGEQFKVVLWPEVHTLCGKKYVPGHNSKGEKNPHYGKSYPGWSKGLTKETDPRLAQMSRTKRRKQEKKKSLMMECLLNHKVVAVEWLTEKQDTYDIEMEGTPNFPLTAGIFVHNSNAEMLGELVDQIANLLKRARAINTSSTSPNFDSKENPMGVTEDIFLPIPGSPDDLVVEEIGGSPDIRWIVDVDELKQQLACALSTPLSLLGGYTSEAVGALGSEAIEKLDIGFARNSKRLQRAIKTGIKRICQIHLAYQNLDPDPSMFEVNMSNPSTAEEKSLQETLDTGTDTIEKFMKMIKEIDPEIDEKEVFNYLNRKILKFEDFDLNQFRKGTIAIGEKKADKSIFERYPILDTDLIAYLPLHTQLVEGKKKTVNLSERSVVLFHNRWKENWEKDYGNVTVIETKGNEKPQHQLTLAEEEERKKKAAEEEQLYNPS